MFTLTKFKVNFAFVAAPVNFTPNPVKLAAMPYPRIAYTLPPDFEGLS